MVLSAEGTKGKSIEQARRGEIYGVVKRFDKSQEGKNPSRHIPDVMRIEKGCVRCTKAPPEEIYKHAKQCVAEYMSEKKEKKLVSYFLDFLGEKGINVDSQWYDPTKKQTKGGFRKRKKSRKRRKPRRKKSKRKKRRRTKKRKKRRKPRRKSRRK